MTVQSGTTIRILSPAPANTTAIIGCAFKIASLPTSGAVLVGFLSSGTYQASLAMNTSGILTFYRGNEATLVGTATMSAYATGAFSYIEVQTTIDPSAGTVIVRIDEAEVLNLTGLNTAATGVATWDSISLVGDGGSAVKTFDDLYVCDTSGSAPCNTFLGDCRVDARRPTAEGTTIGWTPLSGSDNALMVDETTPDDDTTYNSTATVNAIDTLVVEDAPVVGAVLYGAQVVLSIKKSDAGTCTVAPVVRQGSTDYPGTAMSPTASYAYALTPYGLDATGVAWTEANFNAAEFGYKRVT